MMIRKLGVHTMSKIQDNKHFKRDSSIELLRIILMLGVMTLHFNASGVAITSLSGKAFYFMNFTESIFICAVNVFVLISGYYMCTTEKRKIVKPLELLFELVSMNFIWYIFFNVYNSKRFSLYRMWDALLPNKYFIILYICVYVLSPYLNPFLRSLSKTGWRRLMITLIIMFSVWPTVFDFLGDFQGNEIIGISTIGMMGSGRGYTIVSFVLLYIIGAYIRLNAIEDKYRNTLKLCGIFTVCVVIIAFATVLDKYIMLSNGLEVNGICSALEYCNPIVVLEAVVMFLIFKSIHFHSKVINHVAQAAFTCYITHYFFRDYLYRYIGFAIDKGMVYLIGYWLFTIFSLYIMGYFIHILYSKLTKPVFKKIDEYFEKYGLALDFKN